MNGGQSDSKQVNQDVPVISGPKDRYVNDSLYINRDLSWLKFNERVLSQVADARVPLLERLNFLSIVSNNIDEFFMKRIGGIRRHIAVGIGAFSPDGLSPQRQAAELRTRVLAQITEAESLFRGNLAPALEELGVHLLKWSDLTPEERDQAQKIFLERMFPLLTPLAVDTGRPFPLISNLSTSLAVTYKQSDSEEPYFARVKFSHLEPQWIWLNRDTGSDKCRLISCREIVTNNLHEIFPNTEILSCSPFRVVRSSSLEIDEEDAEDLRDLIEEEVRQRRFANVVKLEVLAGAEPWMVDFVKSELDLTSDDLYEVHESIDFNTLRELQKLPFPRAKYTPWVPVTPPSLPEDADIFSVLRKRDVLLHHPYESFSASVERFVREAVEDPKVVAIKMTVYRVGDASPIIPLLIEAARREKQVVCVVELKARFDEESNIYWAELLEDAGVHVVHGIPGLKIHAKTTLVVRQEPEGVRTYAHISTGNYHAQTANLYTDMGLLTSKPAYTHEAIHFFNYLTGRSLKDQYKTLLVAPVNMEKKLLEMIDVEIAHAQEGRPARIIAKMNGLDDRHVIERLYAASQANVKVDLLVRGVCSLRPGVPGISENIRVISIVGRLLEHSRIYFFQDGNEDPIQGQFFIGSADCMERNLHRRVELLAPISEPSDRKRCWQALQVSLNDCSQGWEMSSDGSYTRRKQPEDRDPKEALGTHERLMQITRELAANM